MSDSSDYDDDSVDSGEDEIAISTQTLCLLCPKVYQTADKTMKHMLTEHASCFRELFKHPKLDFFLYIKVVNYIRDKGLKESDLSLELLDAMELEGDKYLKPYNQEDGLLNLDFEELQSMLRSVGGESSETITIQSSEYVALVEGLRLKETLQQQLSELTERYQHDILSLRHSTQNMLLTTANGAASNSSAFDALSDAPNMSPDGMGDGRVAALTTDEDEGYTSSYSHYSIHLTMLQDEIRTLGYRETILQNPEMFRDKVVLDVGCGTGILSMFAVQAGAKHVYAIDMSEIAYNAMDIIIENGMSEKITVIKEKIEKLELPVTHVDVIISEWMGYFLLFESMFDSVIFARQKWLSPSGIMLPNECVMKLSVSDDMSLYKDHLAFWDDVYGSRMSCMKRQVVGEALVMEVDPTHVTTTSCDIKVVDCLNSTVGDLNFIAEFSLPIPEDTSLTALIGWFDTHFTLPQLSHKSLFSTSPHTKQTHWKQTVFLLPKPYPVIKGSNLEGKIRVEKHLKDPRALSVVFTINSQTLKYTLR